MLIRSRFSSSLLPAVLSCVCAPTNLLWCDELWHHLAESQSDRSDCKRILFQNSFDNMSDRAFSTLYSLNMVAELLVPCYFGSLVTEESDGISRSAFDCDWLKFSKRGKKSILFLMMRANKNIVFTAGGLFTVELAIFLRVRCGDSNRTNCTNEISI